MKRLFKRFSFYAISKYYFTVIPTIEIYFEQVESGSWYFDFDFVVFFWSCGFHINPKV